jgi:hypothetical protein
LETTQTAAPSRARPASGCSQRLAIWLTGIFALGVTAQALLAGAGLFVGGSWMRWHEGIGHLLTSPIPLIPLIVLILSFTARLPAADKGLSALLLVLATLQPVVLYLRGVAPALAALHPAIALLLFALPIWMIARLRRAGAPATQA